MSASGFQQNTLKRKNKLGLALPTSTPAKRTEPSASDRQIPGAIGNNVSSNAGTLEIGVEFQLNLKTDELVVLKELGAGNGGTVSKVMHPATKIVMARKVIHVEAKVTVRKQIVRELHIMKDCQCPNIVTFYGAFLNDAGDVIMCMEYMDAGSLDRISKDFGPVRVDVLGKLTVAILNGLNYLYEGHKIMHRDIKPSNVLVNSRGDIKLCDFGVSGELVNSVADTFVGTSTYMAPERIQGAPYTIRSDVWSVGLTVMELAIGRFPFDASENSSGEKDEGGGILALLQRIVHEPPPRLPKSSAFPTILDEMLLNCLKNGASDRPTPRELYDHDNFVQAAKRTPVDLEAWAVEMMQRSNRKSHLQAPLSPGTQELLRSNGPFSGGSTTQALTPSSTRSIDVPLTTSASTQAYIDAQHEARDSGFPRDRRESDAQTPHYPPEPDPRMHRVMSADVNGSANSPYSTSPSTNFPHTVLNNDRPPFPPRTSSAHLVGQRSKSREPERGLMTNLPVRTAPTQPLPQPPRRNERADNRAREERRAQYANQLYGDGTPI